MWICLDAATDLSTSWAVLLKIHCRYLPGGRMLPVKVVVSCGAGRFSGRMLMLQ
jgi:hypothetical protein